MTATPIPERSQLVIQFAHIAYNLAERFALRDTGIEHFQTWTREDTLARIGEAHVLVASGFWRDEMLEKADRLAFIQVCAAGYDNYATAALEKRGVRLANGSGVNKNAVSEHAIALMLALTRQIHHGRDNQRARHWRAMISDLTRREDELAGKTLLIYGLGAIGTRLARIAKAFDMAVIGIKRDVSRHQQVADEVHPPPAFRGLLPRADFVALTCPLSQETENLIDAQALAAMAPGAYLVNVARGGCVDEAALVRALTDGRIAGAGIDVTAAEPLPEDSPLWSLDNVILTPHTAGETRSYEDNVIDILLDNLERLWRRERALVNGVIA